VVRVRVWKSTMDFWRQAFFFTLIILKTEAGKERRIGKMYR